MSSKTSSSSTFDNSSSQFNVRLPRLTHRQIENLSEKHGLTKTQVIIVAVDRLTRDLSVESIEAKTDVRRLKTVARIAPQFDLGQED